MIVLETERLYLKMLDESSAKDVTNYYKRNRGFFKKWESYKRDDFFSIEYHERLLSLERSEIGNGTRLKLWIYLKENDILIGFINFGNIIRSSFESSFLGFKLDKEQQKHGYMTEALKKALNYYFSVLKLHRVEVNIMPSNLPTQKLVKKLGFTEEGIARKYLKINGQWEDHIHFALLREDFLENSK